jgi:hypothetical protein
MREREAVDEAVAATGTAEARTAAPESATTLPTRVLTLQRSVGNRAVNRILARDAYSDAVKYAKWTNAAKALGDLTDKDVNERLGQLNLGELGGLLGGARDWGAGADGNAVWDPKTNARIRDLIYAHRKKRTFVTFAAGGKVANGKLGSAITWSNDAGMRIELYFLPDPKLIASESAAEIAFVQIVRRLKPDGSVDRDAEQAYAADRTTSTGWHIDAIETDISAFYGFKGLDPSSITYPWYMTTPTLPCFMRDTPGISADGRFEAEAVPVQVAGKELGKAYGAITWGMTKANGKVTTHAVAYKEKPSSDFMAAASAWNAQATNPVKRTSADQQVLPAIK